MSYAVGQVLYVVLRKEATIYPMQVVEEITKKTLEGEVVTHSVRGQDPNKPILVTEIDGEVFDSSEKAKKVLIERVSASISQRVDQAVAKAKEWYPTGREIIKDDPMALIKKVTTVAEAPPKPVKQPKPVKPELAALGAELQAEGEQAMMEMPDGSKVKVKSVKLPGSLQG